MIVHGGSNSLSYLHDLFNPLSTSVALIICTANQLTGFYMRATLALNELRKILLPNNFQLSLKLMLKDLMLLNAMIIRNNASINRSIDQSINYSINQCISMKDWNCTICKHNYINIFYFFNDTLMISVIMKTIGSLE